MNAKLFRTASAVAATAALLATGAQASNVVGYIKVEIPAGLSLVSVPFELVGGGTHTLDSVFGTSVPDSSQVILFDPGVGYEVYTFIEEDDPADSGWFKGRDPAGSTPLPRGSGFWVRNPSSEPIELVLRGEAPVTDVAVTLDVGLRIVSYGFPSEASLDTVSGLQPADTDQLIAFVPGEGFVVYTYVEEDTPEDTGWYKGRDKVSLTLQPGQAFWYRRGGAATVWNQSKNYSF